MILISFIFSSNQSANNMTNSSDLCWENFSYTRHEMYIGYLVSIQIFELSYNKVTILLFLDVYIFICFCL